MTQELVRPTYFATPTVDTLPGTLLTAATVLDNGTDWLETTALMETFNCLPVDSQAVLPCPAVFLGAPTQAASSTATTGGTLAAGTYRAVITAVNERGETVASNEISQVTTGATSTITWNWSNVTGETGYRVYVTTVGGASGSQTFLVNVAANTTSYVWTGTPAPDGSTRPPSTNTAVVSQTKTFNGPSWQDGIRFAVYGGFLCKSFENPADSLAKVRDAFEARESVGVERALMQMRFIAGAGWAAATDLTPAGGAVNPDIGLAILEGDAASKYGGIPTIHAPRTIGSLLTRNGQVERIGDALFSVQGSKIASGGGYQNPNNSPTNTAPPAGEYWMYASGEVVVARSGLVAQTELNRSTNETVALIERLYVAAVDCYTSAVRVKVA
jgi:hypothetical protein